QTAKVILVNLVSLEHFSRGQPAGGIYTLAAYLRSVILGIDVSCINMGSVLQDISADTKEVQYQEAINQVVDVVSRSVCTQPVIVGLSLKWFTFKTAEKIITMLNQRLGDRSPLFVLGNIGSTFGYETALKMQSFMNVLAVLGEGEYALKEIVKKAGDIAAGKIPGVYDYKNLECYRGINNVALNLGGQIICGPRNVVNLNLYPCFTETTAPELFDINAGSQHGLETSRGCPWGHCTFCSIRGQFGKGCKISWRAFPIKKIIDEIRYFAKNGIKKFFSIDSEFMGPMDGDYFDTTEKRINDFADAVNHLNEELSVLGEEPVYISHISVMVHNIYNAKDSAAKNAKRIELCRALHEKGRVHRFYLGIESGSERQLKRYAKGVTVDENRQALRIIKELGIEIEVGFIFFDPFATLEQLKENIEFIEETELFKTDSRILGSLRVQAGSPYVKMAESKGLLGAFDLESLSYASKYEIADVALCQEIFSAFEEPVRGLVRNLTKDFRLRSRKIDFDFVKEMVEILLQGGVVEVSINDLIRKYSGKRDELFREAKANGGLKEDKNGKARSLLEKAIAFNSDIYENPDKLFNQVPVRCSYPLAIPVAAQNVIEEKYGANRVLADVIVNGFDICQPGTLIENHYEVLGDRLA
ncbi:MAG: radical SAM protein, partial [Candidatus Omnitrophota bacterium]